MEITGEVDSGDEFTPFSSTYRTFGFEWEIFTDHTQQIMDSMRSNGITEEEIEIEDNGLSCEGITEIKSHPFGFGSASDYNALETLYSTVDNFYQSAQEINAIVTLDSIDPKTGHTAGNHIHISGNGIEDLMKIARIMQVYKPILMVLANPDNRERVKAFGYKDDIKIATFSFQKTECKKNDILIDLANQRVELRVVPMSEDLNTAAMIPQLLYKLILKAESDLEEMRRIEYLANNSPDGVLTYAQINRNRGINDGLNAYLWDVKFIREDNSFKALPYERPISAAIEEYSTRAGSCQQFLFD